MRNWIVIAAATAFGAPAAAQEDNAAPAAEQAAPCSADVYRAFDFWLGTWDVTDADGQILGRNTITSEEGGCLLVERWSGAGGSSGRSYNFYDPSANAWRQVWVSNGAVIDYMGGLTDAGAMRLEGEIAYRNGAVFPFFGEWTPRRDGTVLQHFEQQDPETGEWSDWFTGVYARVDADADGDG